MPRPPAILHPQAQYRAGQQEKRQKGGRAGGPIPNKCACVCLHGWVSSKAKMESETGERGVCARLLGTTPCHDHRDAAKWTRNFAFSPHLNPLRARFPLFNKTSHSLQFHPLSLVHFLPSPQKSLPHPSPGYSSSISPSSASFPLPIRPLPRCHFLRDILFFFSLCSKREDFQGETHKKLDTTNKPDTIEGKENYYYEAVGAHTFIRTRLLSRTTRQPSDKDSLINHRSTVSPLDRSATITRTAWVFSTTLGV
ncbi:hypothetical protein LZ31DRAFT_317626 [Colletotrichum somersetense]|nr:hypothetical protein LZ31DRAFT_317626 [Colletotrichum somersetense]